MISMCWSSSVLQPGEQLRCEVGDDDVSAWLKTQKTDYNQIKSTASFITRIDRNWSQTTTMEPFVNNKRDVWIRGETIRPKNTEPTVEHGGGSIVIWCWSRSWRRTTSKFSNNTTNQQLGRWHQTPEQLSERPSQSPDLDLKRTWEDRWVWNQQTNQFCHEEEDGSNISQKLDDGD